MTIQMNVSKTDCEISVCDFQSMKNPVKLNSLLLKFFVMSPGLMRDEPGGLVNEAYFSNPIVSLKQ